MLLSARSTVELVANLYGSMPSGVTVTPGGRTFVCFPRWVDVVPFTIGELLPDGRVVAYPGDAENRLSVWDPVHRFFSVQSVNATSDDTLWVLDTGRPYFSPALPGAAKLVEVDLASGALRRVYVVPYGIIRPTTYLNDVRIARTLGAGGTAFITDSATLGPSAIITIDLASGSKMRRLDNHWTVNPDSEVRPTIEGEELLLRLPFRLTFPYRNGADGIALSRDERTLYYCPLTSRRLFSVDAAVLADSSKSDAEVAATIRDLGYKGVSDGLDCDTRDNLYASDLENHQILRRSPTGNWTVFATDERMFWTDTLCAASDGYLYFIANQVHRMWPFHAGCDLRRRPYTLLRAKM
ncbi:MAG: L-dopachrome tautomerase-related protein [Candidatus Velthaea sp.]